VRQHIARASNTVWETWRSIERATPKVKIEIDEQRGKTCFILWPLDCQLLTGWIDKDTRFAPGDLRAATPRFSPESLAQNMKLVDLIKTSGERKQATPAQIAGSVLLIAGYGIGIYLAGGGMIIFFASLISGAWLLLVGICNEKQSKKV
jgi:aryl-alcohol dehydrogenase-like predicted oxidoreductase